MLGWVTSLNTCFLAALYHYDPSNHCWGIPMNVMDFLKPTIWKPRDLPLGEIRVGQLVCTLFQGVHL